MSHFNCLRDNIIPTWMHIHLFLGFVLRLPRLIWSEVSATGK
jgi:hypothetical protein